MKNFVMLLVIILCSCLSYSQTIVKTGSLDLPGDNLNLYAVLDLFQDSKTFESFEKKLNKENSKINNLDLNNDGKIDYIKVIDHNEGEAHSVVLQIPINEKENQDVAVIEIEKDKNNNIKVQIIGNEDLYGKDYIIEPQENSNTQTIGTVNPAAKQDKTAIVNNTTNNYNTTTNDNGGAYLSVSYWPMWGYMYAPAYTIYSSPWYWNNYPTWWQPWTPWYWSNYYWHHYHSYNHYHNYYHQAVVYRNESAHNYYGPRRSSSALVQKNRSEGVYLKSYYDGENRQPIKLNAAENNPVYEPNCSNKNAEQIHPNENRPQQRSQAQPQQAQPQQSQQSQQSQPQQSQPRQQNQSQLNNQKPIPQNSNRPRGGVNRRK